MSEMKPEDVMRALECWQTQEECKGDECPVFAYETASCARLMAKKALALLREKDALIAKHEAYIDTLNDDKANLVEQIEKKDAEIERWKTEAENQSVWWRDNFHSVFQSAKETIRAKAITEFAERLKAHECLPEYPWNEPFVLARDIDQIAKEMTCGDFPNCKISGCEAAHKDCHIGCPHGKENNHGPK